VRKLPKLGEKKAGTLANKLDRAVAQSKVNVGRTVRLPGKSEIEMEGYYYKFLGNKAEEGTVDQKSLDAVAAVYFNRMGACQRADIKEG